MRSPSRFELEPPDCVRYASTTPRTSSGCQTTKASVKTLAFAYTKPISWLVRRSESALEPKFEPLYCNSFAQLGNNESSPDDNAECVQRSIEHAQHSMAWPEPHMALAPHSIEHAQHSMALGNRPKLQPSTYQLPTSPTHNPTQTSSSSKNSHLRHWQGTTPRQRANLTRLQLACQVV